MKHSPTLSYTGSICTVESARSKMNIAYQALINAKNMIFNKLRESEFKTYTIGTADIYDKELDRIREDYYQCKLELMQFCNKPDIEKDCCTMEREFQYQYLDAKEKIVELRNLEEKQKYSSTSTNASASSSSNMPTGVMTSAMNYTQASPGVASMLKCESCYSVTQRVNVTLRCELCKKSLGALVFNSN